ncbi:MAG: hypothetical protein LC646_03000, partial [Xanthomonadaceae bacterium]|nr:hypothetical protein [Xanthomonadaceae bacterium]
LTVTITDAMGNQTVLAPGNPAVRAVVNFYPDPVSNVVVSREAGLDTSAYAGNYASQIMNNYTGGDKDWWQTVVFVDLPLGMFEGDATVLLNTPQESATSVVTIVPGTGSPNPFSAYFPWGTSFNMTEPQLQSLSRASHYEVSFTGGVVPAGIQLQLSHDPDIDQGGSGRAVVINPVGVVKNVHWVDNGTTITVMLLPASGGTFIDMRDFKFYVAGGVGNLAISSVQAYDLNGNSVTGVAANITLR